MACTAAAAASVDSGSKIAEVASAGDCEGGARESTFRSASVWGAGVGDGDADLDVEGAEVGGGGGALGSEISRRAAIICSRTRIVRSATSATVRPVVGMGGNTISMRAFERSTANKSKIRTRSNAQSAPGAKYADTRMIEHEEHTSELQRPALKHILPIQPPIILTYNRYDRYTGLHRKMEGALLEWQHVVVRAH